MKKPDLTSEEIYECLNVVKYNQEDRKAVEKAFSKILAHRAIAKKMAWEAKKFASRNAELSRRDLLLEAATVLYSAIKSEWTREKDPSKAVSWCCARIGWRVATHVTKEVGLDRSVDETGKGVYSRPDRVDLSDEMAATLEAPIPAGQRYKAMADIIRDSSIEPKYKHPLVYVLILGASFKELGQWYGCTAPTASNIYKKALAAFKDYVKSSSPEEEETIFETIKELIDR